MHKRILFLIFISNFLISCGGGNSGGSNTQEIKKFTQNIYYVDLSGNCNGRIPCYSVIYDALKNSFLSQFNKFYSAQRLGAPADKIIVMPGVYSSSDPSSYVF